MSNFTDLEDIINNKESYAITDEMKELFIGDVKYTGFSKVTFYWHKTAVEQPDRADNGAMGNVNEEIATFKTPHIKVVYDIMTIDTYRSLMNQYLDKMEYVVKCYDPVYNKVSEHKLYISAEQEPDYYIQNWTDSEGNPQASLIGVKNYTFELIGTNNPLN